MIFHELDDRKRVVNVLSDIHSLHHGVAFIAHESAMDKVKVGGEIVIAGHLLMRVPDDYNKTAKHISDPFVPAPVLEEAKKA